jgi:hypothetical protein
MQINGTLINGSVSVAADGGPLARNTPTPGKISAAGEVDDWTFYGRAGELITVIAGAGSGGLLAPVAPALNSAQVTLLDPSGNSLASGSNPQTGADVSLPGVVLPADGSYHVRVQAPAGLASATGDYVLSIWDAPVHTSPLNLNQTVAGRLGTPFAEDHWTFTAARGDQVRFDLVNATTPAIQFDLTGPGGSTLFGGANTSSDLISLLVSGTYDLTVHVVPLQRGAYAFRLEQSSVTDLTLNAAYHGTFAGAGQAQLFRVDVPALQQLQVVLQDAAPADRAEVYAARGTARRVPTSSSAPPTRPPQRRSSSSLPRHQAPGTCWSTAAPFRRRQATSRSRSGAQTCS